jgi:hypothetical protein
MAKEGVDSARSRLKIPEKKRAGDCCIAGVKRLLQIHPRSNEIFTVIPEQRFGAVTCR